MENTVRSMTTWRTATGEPVTTIAVEQPDGHFLAYVAHDPDVRATAKTAFAAEQAAIEIYERGDELRRSNPAAATALKEQEELEDEQAVEEFLKREAAGKTTWHDLDDVLREHGRR